MNWTDVATVKKHLLGFVVDGLIVRDVKVVLEADEIQLPHQSIESGSLRVAAMLEDEPSGPVQLVLNGITWYSVGDPDLLNASITVSTDNMPTDRYIEGLDFGVNHEDGEIKRFDGGNITSGQTVYVWYLPLTVYTEDTDYTIDYAEGILERTTPSSIPDPARLRLDYRTYPYSINDSFITLAITEAEDKILARLREGYDEDSDDQGLKTGATELTLSIICDDLAMKTLNVKFDSGSDDRARRFMDLSGRFEQRAASTLARFLTQPLMSELRIKSNPVKGGSW
ncbi:MAG: hypothetical protein P9L92_18750 [Candidatus Electryonea clarkiae]|nr:hypothetical protein [Candidatus Electryonea clarkiae]MDP8287839.1 hypothetical protein [Candidatus Electryonea clarkiae]